MNRRKFRPSRFGRFGDAEGGLADTRARPHKAKPKGSVFLLEHVRGIVLRAPRLSWPERGPRRRAQIDKTSS
eukprot:826135-Prymnesium_polylepis.1